MLPKAFRVGRKDRRGKLLSIVSTAARFKGVDVFAEGGKTMESALSGRSLEGASKSNLARARWETTQPTRNAPLARFGVVWAFHINKT